MHHRLQPTEPRIFHGHRVLQTTGWKGIGGDLEKFMTLSIIPKDEDSCAEMTRQRELGSGDGGGTATENLQRAKPHVYRRAAHRLRESAQQTDASNAHRRRLDQQISREVDSQQEQGRT